MSPHTLSTKARQQGRMYVHHTIFISVRYFPQAKPPALYDKVNICSYEFVFDMLAELIDIRMVLSADYFDVKSGFFRPLDAGHFRARTYNYTDLGMQLALLGIVEDVY